MEKTARRTKPSGMGEHLEAALVRIAERSIENLKAFISGERGNEVDRELTGFLMARLLDDYLEETKMSMMLGHLGSAARELREFAEAIDNLRAQ